MKKEHEEQVAKLAAVLSECDAVKEQHEEEVAKLESLTEELESLKKAAGNKTAKISKLTKKVEAAQAKATKAEDDLKVLQNVSSYFFMKIDTATDVLQ